MSVTKKWQKLIKIIKTQKHEKVKNSKSDKINKIKIIKIDKNRKCKTPKIVKKWQNPKKAKMSDKWHFLTLCEIRAAWSGTFWVPGGTTGPDS